MNKKIYFNDSFIEFIEAETQTSHNQAFNFHNGKTLKSDDLKKLIKNFLNTPSKETIQISGPDFDAFLKAIKPHFYYIEAAGGFIEKSGVFLFIHRHGRWDLPKGKLEKGETVKSAAVRECEEECGVKELQIQKPMNSTFHIYPYKDGHALKQSYWFYMHTDYSGELIPQNEEDINEARWFTKAEIESGILKDTYHTIRDVAKEGLGL